jgi:hypothetical protein
MFYNQGIETGRRGEIYRSLPQRPTNRRQQRP